MKKLNSSLFSKFESSRVSNMARLYGGTKYTERLGPGDGCDKETTTTSGDFTDTDCNKDPVS